jgi:hypothetical protein
VVVASLAGQAVHRRGFADGPIILTVWTNRYAILHGDSLSNSRPRNCRTHLVAYAHAHHCADRDACGQRYPIRDTDYDSLPTGHAAPSQLYPISHIDCYACAGGHGHSHADAGARCGSGRHTG